MVTKRDNIDNLCDCLEDTLGEDCQEDTLGEDCQEDTLGEDRQQKVGNSFLIILQYTQDCPPYVCMYLCVSGLRDLPSQVSLAL